LYKRENRDNEGEKIHRNKNLEMDTNFCIQKPTRVSGAIKEKKKKKIYIR
jgi:hypothetical protein